MENTNTMENNNGRLAALVVITLSWAFLWALPGGVIELIDNIAPSAHSFTRQIDMWPQTLGLPGLVGGALFSMLLLIPGRGRRVAELSTAESGAWGGGTGVVVGVLVVWVMDAGLSDPWQLGAALTVIATLMGAISGMVSPLPFRYAAQRRASAIS